LDDFDDHLPLMDEMMKSLDTLIEDEGIDFYLCCSAGYFGVDGAIAAVIQSFCD
jgi:hypothetical protein